jgi:hypothetical protein
MARTPALLVPATPEGRFYNALPDFAARIANAVDPLIRQAAGDLKDLAGAPLFNGSKERLERLLLDAVNQFSFDDVKAYGVQNVAKLLTNLPIFPSDDAGELVDFAAGKTPLEVLARRLPNGTYRFPAATSYALLGRIWLRDGAYRYIDEYGGAPKIFFDATYGVTFSEEIAYWMTADPPVGLFGLDAVTKIAGQLLERFDKQGSSGAAWQQIGPQAFIKRVAERFIAITGLDDINDLGLAPTTREVIDAYTGFASIEDVYSYIDLRTGRVIDIDPSLYGFTIEGFGEGEGFTWASLLYENGQWVFRTTGEATGLKAFLSSDLFKIVSIGLAIWGIGAALASISTGGATFLNVAQLTASVDNLPGVDLGVVGDVAKGLSFGINAASSIPGAESMFDFEPGSFDLPEFDAGGFDIPVVDPGSLEVSLTLEDIGAGVIDFDTSIFADFGLEATDLIPDDFGNIFTVTGEAVMLDPETYVKSIYIDEGGNYRDYTNRVLLSQPEADAIFNESGADNDAVFAELATRAQGLAGNAFVAEAGPNGRPAGTPAPAARGEVPFFQVVSEQVMGWFKTITAYSLAKEQLEKTGRYTPPYQTNTNGTDYSQVPGVPVRRADGSTVVNNGNGTQTIQYPNGQVQTVPTNLNPQSFNQSQFGGGALIPGISNQTLLIAGAGLLAVALLARRK